MKKFVKWLKSVGIKTVKTMAETAIAVIGTNATVKMANVLGANAEEVSNYMTAIWNNFDDGSKSIE